MKYHEFRDGLENDWNKKNNNNSTTINEAYTLLETYKGSEKSISHIVQKNKPNIRSETNSNSKTNVGWSCNKDGDSDEQHVKDNSNETWTCFKCERSRHISPNYMEITTEDDSLLNNKEQSMYFVTRPLH